MFQDSNCVKGRWTKLKRYMEYPSISLADFDEISIPECADERCDFEINVLVI